MKKIYVVTPASNNRHIVWQIAFNSLEEAEKFRDHIDRKRGATSSSSLISCLCVVEKASDIIMELKDES